MVRPNSPPQIDQRVVEQAALLQVLDQRRADGWSTSRGTGAGCRVGQVAVLVPAVVIELDEAHAALGQPPRQQAVGARRCPACVTSAPYSVEGRLRLAGDVHHARARWSASGRPSRTARCARRSRGRRPLRAACCLQVARGRRACARRLSGVDAGGIVEVEHRVAAAAELHALVLRRQEAAAPQPRVERLVDLAGRARSGRRTPAGSAFSLPEPVATARRPCSAGPAMLRAGLEEGDGRVVVDRLGVHRADDAELVDDLRRVRQQVADPRAAACRAARSRTATPASGSDDWLPDMPVSRWPCRTESGNCSPLRLSQQRLVVEQLDLRRAAGHEQVDDALGLRRRSGAAAEHARAHCRAARDLSAAERPAGLTRLASASRRAQAERFSTAGGTVPAAGSGPCRDEVAAVVAHGRSRPGSLSAAR